MRWSDIPGWFDFQVLYDEAVLMAEPGAILVEVGNWLGRSLAYLGQAAQQARKDLLVVGVDHGRGVPEDARQQEPYRPVLHALGGTLAGALARNLLECGLTSTVLQLTASSRVAAKILAPVSFVFIDGDHSREGVTEDILSWLPRLKPGGWLAGHDYKPDNYVGQAVRSCFPGRDCQSQMVKSCWIYQKEG
jgi:hypothetical protein